ncbi:histidine phosphatase family protein [Mucilaginibacter sabulilitoris]|uniref:Histidine phosphatase family protein n=1 Tax=Mucilaginibacter sabulilitoris TaxID=1173583 RepID=A0ABZ0TKK4_9SPHI|nr:histidine phosphatase family protein [Mucilaginibacter sabulilitoris]WPU92723.1 histidine phosphatase family protein [Mucilaginibacter sabulilitoris]
MLSVYLLRHGETTYNADGNRYCGRTDASLTNKGIKQAVNVFHQLKDEKFNAVYSSPLSRACLTAQIATESKQVQTDERIIEVDFGTWEGKTKEEFIAEEPSLWEAWMSDPANAKAGGTGETGAEVIERVDSFFNEMLQKHANQTIVVVAHNGINRLYMAYKLGMELKNYRRIFQENSAITFFELDDTGEITLKRLNA